MRKGSIWRIVALLMALAMVAAACGSDSDDTTTTTAAAAATTTTTSGPDATTTTAAPAPTPCVASIGIMGPFTGDAAFIGLVQLNWAKYAVDLFNDDMGSNITLIEFDTMIDPAQGAILAPQLLDDSDIVGVVGPAGSQVVDAVGPIFDPEGMVFISPSSTQVGLGAKYTGLFRTVPLDDVQGPTTAAFMVEAGAQKVFIIDDQTSYSTGLADEVKASLEAAGVEVPVDSVIQDATDFSALVSTIPEDTDFVYLPWQIAANGQILANQLAEQGKDITIFGSDGMDSADFDVEGSLVATFAPDIAGIPASAELLAGFLAEFPETSTFGPPSFAATKVLLEAIDRVCQVSETPARASVLAEVGNTNQSDTILGTPLSFDADGEVDGGAYFIQEIQSDGSYLLVG
jgi:branched-chain amino acid transport system substrate-binding protein